MTQPKVALEVCEKELAKLCALRRIQTDTAGWNDKEKTAFERRKAPLIRAMSRGELKLDKAGLLVFTPPGEPTLSEAGDVVIGKPGEPITFYPSTGATLMEGDGYAENHDVGRLVAIATAMTKSATGALSKLPGPDFQLLSDIVNFLTAR